MINRILTLTALLGASMTQMSYAAPITNDITGVGPKSSPVNPVFCIQAGEQVTYPLKKGETVDGNKYSQSKYYVGGTLRFGGCSEENTYLGYVGFSVNDDTKTYAKGTYTPPKGVHIAYTNYNIDKSGRITGQIQYTPIKPNDHIIDGEPSKNPNWPFVGINLSGLEFGRAIDPVVIPNLSEEDVGANSDLAEVKSFLQAGMNTIRVPISWGFLQLDGAGKGELNQDYLNSYVKPLLESLTAAHVHTIVDLHAYMRYSEFGKEYSGCMTDSAKCPDGTLITDSAAFVDVWTKLVMALKADKKIDMNYIMLDLMNEPVDVPGDFVFTAQVDMIKAVRSAGFQGYILVEGNSWSGLHSWTNKSWTTNGKTYTNASLFTRENFEKAGVKDLDKIIINVHQYLDDDYSGTKDVCLTDLSTTGENGFNLDAFVNYLQANKLKAIVTEFGSSNSPASKANCSLAMQKMMNYLKENSVNNKKDYGFIGWTIWSAGHGWGQYKLRVEPKSYHMDVLKEYLQPK